MCATCGCSDGAGVRLSGPGTAPPEHQHDGHGHGAIPVEDGGRTVPLEQRVLAKNDVLAERNRAWLREQEVLAINLMSSPGSGKTTLLERTLRDFGARQPVSVVEGDQETTLDAERLRTSGHPVVQVNTGAGCHLDADMLAGGLGELRPAERSVVLIENVGNLVCPALFDLGEQQRVVIASVTEGEDKPLKYPHMFRTGDLVLLNKVDLLPHLDFDTGLFVRNAKRVNGRARVLQVSATKGDGLRDWYDWLEQQLPSPPSGVR